MYRLGIDLGGTKIEGILLDEAGAEHHRKRIHTEQEKGYASIIDRIGSMIDELTARADGEACTIGVGTPGALSHKTGLLKNSNTVCMLGKPVKDDIEKRVGRRINMQNDANCFAMAEAIYGAGKGKEMVFGVIMGTGCGGGIVHHGKVHVGHQAIGGEWGHMVIDPKGPRCYCGANGCVETFISGGGLQRRYAGQFGRQRSFIDIVKDYRDGDADTAAFIQRFLEDFGRAMANLIAVLDPDVVILGGGVSNFDELYTKGVAEVAKRVFSDSLETPILRHQLGDSAGVIGAALVGI